MKLETKDHILTISIDWKMNKRHPMKNCAECDGRGYQGGGFRGPEREDCPYCNNGKVIDWDKIEPKPEIPEDLVRCMRKAYDDYLKGIKPVVKATDGGVASEIEYQSESGTVLGYWAYGSWNPGLPYKGEDNDNTV